MNISCNLKRNILIIFFKELKNNHRAIKQIRLLNSDFNIILAGYSSNDLFSDLQFTPIKPKFKQFNLVQKFISFILLFFGFHNWAYKFLYDLHEVKILINNNSFDLIIAHDLKPLKLIFDSKISYPSKVLLDAHEYFLDTKKGVLNKFLFQRYDSYFLNKYIRKVDHIDTVNESIRQLYKNITDKPISYTINVPNYHDLEPSHVDFPIRIIHHGFADPNRKLELMIELMKSLDKSYQLDLMLVNLTLTDTYISRLKSFAEGISNVNFITPVNPDEIIPFINQYDIGLYILPDHIMNMKYALPNKLFDFIQARLMIAIGPSHEMSKIVNQYRLGIVAPSFDPKLMADKLKALTKEDIYQYKLNAHEAAHELCAEKQLAGLQKTIEHLLADNSKS